MTKEKSIRYKKAYTELNEIFKILDKEQKDKIPNDFINNISNNMDKDYKFELDSSKGIFEQELMVETEALLVEIYERYLAPEEKKKEKYKQNIFENNKKAINPQHDKNVIESIQKDNILPIESKKENLFEKILNFIKKIFNKK